MKQVMPMKVERILHTIMLILILTLLTGCQVTNSNETAIEDESYDLSQLILGQWEYGFGMSRPFQSARSIEFLADGTYVANGIEGTWVLNKEGELVVEDWFMPGDAVIVLSVEVTTNTLMLTDEWGNVRTWGRSGTREVREDLDFLGSWEFEHGATFDAFGGRPPEIEFLADGRILSGEQQTRYWELGENDELLLEIWGGVYHLIVDVDGNRMTIEDERGFTGMWVRVNSGERNRDWLITAYLDYFEVEDGYYIVNNIEIAGEQFDFVVYELREMDENEWGQIDWYFMVVVKQDGIVWDVLHHPSYPPTQPGIHRIVVEVDINFDGLNDVLLFQGAIGNSAWRNYYAYLQLDGALVEVEFPGNPWLDWEREIVLSAYRSGAAWHAWQEHVWVDNELVTVAILERDAREIGVTPENLREGYRLIIFTEKLLVNDQWQERELCIYMSDDWSYHEVCNVEDYDVSLYQEIFGINPRWDQRFHTGPATWHEESGY